ncbi:MULTISPECIES: dihydroneopterin aldolase [unclassified Sphingomonas]|uniref:dihydroneopterin aldolase n=1 Tax=unclassified Sphingomonas TaxID=196159 RepID=UPI0006F6072D|nr:MULTISPECIES: dihydroneopterin aldolase [unclassified Sphingomonas]KQX25994.1 hypothetical protein ASD17_00535 [Sphingomonas sp. Root1294]KQY69060.1 hypothetical protein ASD39_01730 [Sphingomonas sp. Root50]KRB89314.1 hypothetical protein ASE22_16645 [Sphingomonas sp. Root720]
MFEDRRGHDRSPALIARQQISIEDLVIEADIGVDPDEIGRRQTLIVDIRLDVMPVWDDRLDATADYRSIADRAARLGQSRTGLIEIFANRLAAECLFDPRVLAVEIRVRKPLALVNGTASASVRLVRNGADGFWAAPSHTVFGRA